MRIAIAGYAFPDTFTDNVAFTLRQMGHDVATTPPPLNIRIFARLGRMYGEVRSRFGYYREPYERWLLAFCRENAVDLVLAITRHLGEETLRDLRKCGVQHLVAWWGDPPAYMMQGSGLFVPGWDLVCLKDQRAVAGVRSVGLNAHILHEAMNPAWHRPIASQANEAVIVAGTWTGFRQGLVRRLLRDGHEVHGYGPPFPAWGAMEVRRAHRGSYIAREAKSRVFGEGLACLNNMSFAEGDALNCRAFEIAGAGGLQVIEHRHAISECFEPGREVLVYETYEQLVEHLAWAKRCPSEARRVRQAGAARAHAEHTYRQRLERMLSLLGIRQNGPGH